MSITKTIDYWLPDELWREVKQYMGLIVVNKKNNMRWDLINKYTTIEDMDEVSLLTIDGQEDTKWKGWSFNIKKNGSILIHHKNKQYTPKEFQLIRAKKKVFDKRKMTPKKWVKLNNAIIKRIKPFDRLKDECRFESVSSFHNNTKYYYVVSGYNSLSKTKVKIFKYLDPDYKYYLTICHYTKKQFNDSFKGSIIYPEGLRVNDMKLI